MYFNLSHQVESRDNHTADIDVNKFKPAPGLSVCNIRDKADEVQVKLEIPQTPKSCSSSFNEAGQKLSRSVLETKSHDVDNDDLTVVDHIVRTNYSWAPQKKRFRRNHDSNKDDPDSVLKTSKISDFCVIDMTEDSAWYYIKFVY